MHAGEGLAFEVDHSMKSDRCPSLWEEEVFSKLSGMIIHVFDKQFVGKEGYRALYDDIVAELDRIRFESANERHFVDLIDVCLEASSDGKVYVCSDMQFGPRPKRYKAMSLKNFLSHYQRFGLRINSCFEIVAH